MYDGHVRTIPLLGASMVRTHTSTSGIVNVSTCGLEDRHTEPQESTQVIAQEVGGAGRGRSLGCVSCTREYEPLPPVPRGDSEGKREDSSDIRLMWIDRVSQRDEAPRYWAHIAEIFLV